MGKLSDNVLVTIDAQTKALSLPGFGVPMLLAYHTAWGERVRTFSSLEELTAAGVATSSSVYKMATALLSQNPSVSTFEVARRFSGSLKRFDVSLFDLVPGHRYSGTVSGNPVSLTVGASQTPTQVGTALKAQIDSFGLPLTVTVAGAFGRLECLSTAAGTIFPFEGFGNSLRISDFTPDPGIAADYNAAIQYGSNAYAVILDSCSVLEAMQLAPIIETEQRVLFARTADIDATKTSSTTDLPYLVNASSLSRTNVWYHYDFDTYIDAAAAGTALPVLPGGETLHNQTFSGVRSYPLGSGDRLALIAKHANYYDRIAGNGYSGMGWGGGGKYIDETRFVDWLMVEIQGRIMSTMGRLSKIAYTDTGIAILKTDIRGALDLGVLRGGIDGDREIAVTAPLVADIAINEKAVRNVPDIKFTAYLQGAIHTVRIEGTVKL
jgi:hypothetical protein